MLTTSLINTMTSWIIKLTPHINLLFEHSYNPENKVRIRDFKIITEQVGAKSWKFTILDPQNKPFKVQNPRIYFETATWSVTKNTRSVPWFVSQLPNTLFVLFVQWWIRTLAYKKWINSDKPQLYSELMVTL